MQIAYFQRKPRPHGNFSIELVFDTLRRELPEQVNSRVCEAPAYSSGLFRRLWITWHARQRQAQLNHVTGDINFVALGLDGKRTILTNHDCAFVETKRGLRRWLLQALWLRLPVKHVAAVTTVSQKSKEEIVRYTGCNPDKVYVIPNAVSSAFNAVPKAFNSERPRILQIGTAPNKNLLRLAEALRGIRCTLVIVGPIDGDTKRTLAESRVAYENYLDLTTAELVQQYQQCDVVAFVSLYEGFGIPILEAQAVGRPLITSDRQPMADVAGEGACLVDPTDAKAIRSRIERIIADAQFRESLIERGFDNVKRFQPAEVARQYLAVYQSVLDNSPLRSRASRPSKAAELCCPAERC